MDSLCFAASLALSVLASGCLLNAGPYEGAGSGAAGSGASGGGGASSTGGASTGGSSTGGASTGGTSTTSSSGGGMSTTSSSSSGQCMVAADCPSAGTLCFPTICDNGTCKMMNAPNGTSCGASDACNDEATCVDGVCAPHYKNAGTFVTQDPTGDCQKIICDGNGNQASTADDTDTPGNNNECRSASCSGGAVVETSVGDGDPCGFDLGGCCNGVCCLSIGFHCCGKECCTDLQTCCPDGSCKGIGPC